MLEPYMEDFAMLVELGFMAIYQGDPASATALFLASNLMKPDHSAPKLGLSHIAIYQLKFDEAKQLLNEVLQMNSENHEIARALLGICEIMHKQNADSGIKHLEQAMASTDEEAVHKLGKAGLDWWEKEQKKSTRIL